VGCGVLAGSRGASVPRHFLDGCPTQSQHGGKFNLIKKFVFFGRIFFHSSYIFSNSNSRRQVHTVYPVRGVRPPTQYHVSCPPHSFVPRNSRPVSRVALRPGNPADLCMVRSTRPPALPLNLTPLHCCCAALCRAPSPRSVCISPLTATNSVNRPLCYPRMNVCVFLFLKYSNFVES